MTEAKPVLRWNGENLTEMPRLSSTLIEWGIRLRPGVEMAIEIEDINLENSTFTLCGYLLRGDPIAAKAEDHYLINFAASLSLARVLGDSPPVDIGSFIQYQVEASGEECLSFKEIIKSMLQVLLDQRFTFRIRIDNQLSGSQIAFVLFSQRYTNQHLVERRPIDDRLRQFFEID